MKIAISGSSGFIGRHLTNFFTVRGDEVVSLKRSLFERPDTEPLRDVLTDCEVVINLAGAPVNQRWTFHNKRDILYSRVDTTRRLVEVMNAMERKPSLFISVSAIGIYPSDGIYTEESKARADNFLSTVCKRWEREARRISHEIRLVIPRLGVVLAADGGALPRMLLPFRFFLGGKIASGNQGFSWIHIKDVEQIFRFVINHKALSGVINCVSPQPITNRVFTQAVSEVLHRPSWLPVPSFVFWLLYGAGSVVVTSGQQVYPVRLLDAGYVFRYSDIRVALSSFIPD